MLHSQRQWKVNNISFWRRLDIADHSGLLVKLQAKGVITDRHKRHLQVTDVVGCYCVNRISLWKRLTLKITVNF